MGDHETATRSVGSQPCGATHQAAERFVVLEPLGEGGMGVVYKAYDAVLRREVALKLVKTAQLSDGMEVELLHEAQSMAALSHPNVVNIYDAHVDRDHLVLAMEYVAGQTLHDWLRAKDRHWRDVLDVFVAAGRGLAAAHRVGLVHRDFKPTNVLVAHDASVRVTDFGLAATIGTRAEVMGGTPKFMAPEQHAHTRIDGRSDQFSFCAALWEALSGQAPFDAGQRSPDALLAAKRAGPTAWPKPTRVPTRIVAALGRGLAADPEHRWPTMDALLHALSEERRSRGRREAATVGSAAGVAAAAWLWTWHTDRAERCTGAQEGLAGIWDDERSGTVRAALLQTGVAYAPATWTRVRDVLDAYAGQWKTQHVDACESTNIRGEQPPEVMDLRMGCLRRASIELRAVVKVLAKADAQVLEKAVQLTSSLPPLRVCADVPGLLQQVPAPAEPEDARKVQAARERLADAKALVQAGKYQDALVEATAAEASVERVDYEPVRAEIGLIRGNSLERLGRLDDAEAVFIDAIDAALAQAATHIAAHTLAQLTFVVGHRLQRHDEGLKLGALALALAQSEPDDEATQAMARNSLATVLHVKGAHAQAESEYRAAFALRERALGPTHPLTSMTAYNIGLIVNEAGRHAQAQLELRHALALARESLSADHPTMASFHAAMGAVLYHIGSYEEAEAEHRRALEVNRMNFGDRHESVAKASMHIGLVLWRQRRHDEAEAAFREALALFETLPASLRPHTAMCRVNLGTALTDQGRHAEAEAELREGLAIFEDVVGATHPWSGESRILLARVLTSQGRAVEAEQHLHQAVGVLRQRLADDHPTLAKASHELGRALVHLGRAGDAKAHLEHAWRIRSGTDAPAEDRAETAFVLAKALWAQAQRERALELAHAARSDYASSSGPEQLREVDDWLAERR